MNENIRNKVMSGIDSREIRLNPVIIDDCSPLSDQQRVCTICIRRDVWGGNDTVVS